MALGRRKVLRCLSNLKTLSPCRVSVLLFAGCMDILGKSMDAFLLVGRRWGRRGASQGKNPGLTHGLMGSTAGQRDAS